MTASAAVITVPAFASARDGVRHFFGTRRHADLLALAVGVPAHQSGAHGRGWLLSVKQVHGTDALVVDRPLTDSDQFPGGWDALVTDQPGVTVAVRTVGASQCLCMTRAGVWWRRFMQAGVARSLELFRRRSR